MIMLKIEPRKNRSNFLEVSAPVIAVFLTMIFGGFLFLSMGKNPFEAIKLIFWDPIMSPTFSEYSRPQLVIKAAPLILIALGLSFGFRANIWNIGAEGQYIMGALISGSIGLALYPLDSMVIFPLMILGGIIGGILWAMIPAILKIRFNTNEILVSLMLVYVAEQILALASVGFLRNPEGLGFPGSRDLSKYPSAANPELIAKILAKRGCNKILWECGPRLATAAIKYNCIQEIITFIAPKILGGENSMSPFGDFEFEEMKEIIKLSDSQVRLIGSDICVKSLLKN